MLIVHVLTSDVAATGFSRRPEALTADHDRLMMNGDVFRQKRKRS